MTPFILFHNHWIAQSEIESVGFGTERDGKVPVVIQTRSHHQYSTNLMSHDDAIVEIRRLLRALGNQQMPPPPTVKQVEVTK
jgi:hypothetical protein